MHDAHELVNTQLAAIAADVNAHHIQVYKYAKSALEHARQAGEQLAKAKSLLSHGEWLPWLSANCQISPRQAQRYLRVADNWEAISNATSATYLTIDGALDSVRDEPLLSDSTCIDEPDCTNTDCDDEPPDEPQLQLRPHVANNGGDNEWYTPKEFIDAAVAVMGGIDLDPASSSVANDIVGAKRFYDADSDGLRNKWEGALWLNPPYAQPAIGQFCEKLVSEFKAGSIIQAISLTNNASETKWMQTLLKTCTAICLPAARIKFLDPNGNPSGAPLQGQAILYFGGDSARFVESFSQFGFCSEVPR